MGLFSFFKGRGVSYTIVFDIESATVGAALVRRYKHDTPEILFTTRVRISYDASHDADKLATAVARATQNAAAKARDALATLDTNHNNDYAVHAVIHAPWADVQAQRAAGILEEETVITKDVLREFTRTHLAPKPISARTEFDHHIVRIELNGYTTNNPYNKRADHLAVTVLKSSMAQPAYKAVRGAFEEVFPEHDVHIDAFAYVATQLPELSHAAETYTIVDVGGEYTAIYIVHEHTIVATARAPFGTEYLIRALVKDKPEARKNALSELSMYFANTCTPAQCHNIEAQLKDVARNWTHTFGDACARVKKHHRIPTTTFVVVDEQYVQWFRPAIEKIDFGQFTVTGRPLKTRVVHPDTAQRPLTYVDEVARDTLLSIDTTFVDK